MRRFTAARTSLVRTSLFSIILRIRELSFSNIIPVIFPAIWPSPCFWISRKRRSPSICFCSCGGAAANMAGELQTAKASLTAHKGHFTRQRKSLEARQKAFIDHPDNEESATTAQYLQEV